MFRQSQPFALPEGTDAGAAGALAVPVAPLPMAQSLTPVSSPAITHPSFLLRALHSDAECVITSRHDERRQTVRYCATIAGVLFCQLALPDLLDYADAAAIVGGIVAGRRAAICGESPPPAPPRRAARSLRLMRP